MGEEREITSREHALRVYDFLRSADGKRLKESDPEDHAQIVFLLHCYRLKTNQKYRIQHYSIVDKKTGEIIPFGFNRGQEKLWGAINRQRKSGRNVRIDLLKHRQWGGSTLTAAFMFDETMFGQSAQNCRTLILSYEIDNAIHLFSMQETIYDNPPEGLSFPHRKKAAERHWIFEGLQAHIQVATAAIGTKSRKKGRGHTRRFVHVSEVAYFEKAEGAMLGVINSVPDDPTTGIILETTANGSGDYFERHWKMAVEGKNEYMPVFVGWHELPEENSLAFVDSDEKVKFEREMTREQAELQRLYNLTLEQLNWQRFILNTKCDGNPRLFQQEYPICWEEAFLTTGHKRFNVYIMDNLTKIRDRENYKNPPQRFTITPNGEFVKDDHGLLYVWKEPEKYNHPKPPREYLLSADVAEGIEISEDGRERDDSAFHVLARGNMAVDQPEGFKSIEQVAKWSGKIEPYNFADILYFVGLWYNRALLVCEAKGSGSMINYILQHVKKYPYIYCKDITDKLTLRTSKSLGFTTTVQSKVEAIDTLSAMLENDEIQINDNMTLNQMSTYITKNKKIEAQIGCKDDLVMALAIGCYANLGYSHFKKPEDSIIRDNSFETVLRHIRKDLKWSGPKVKKLERPIPTDKSFTPTFG